MPGDAFSSQDQIASTRLKSVTKLAEARATRIRKISRTIDSVFAVMMMLVSLLGGVDEWMKLG
ncbi:uncharacterized protein RCC_01795 [Ramularia collo-cygni]|uniref:Uncharacterized protein n=1 Tax=Ramularia collo-cygni TaxID=112498 RepID=A0A2D3UXT0_9PEZI|nr:uncharacterized protein RCC_01795 [Ramularia collo-cygni]CZT15956.1 uncharacterized protein RCC_01795 [Ramularia collo-cygni]